MAAGLKETDLYEPIKQWLEERDWDVYSEVQPFAYGSRADIVALQGKASLIVEQKTSLNLELIGQAIGWLHQANYVYVAVPHRKVTDTVNYLLKHFGIGLFLIHERPKSIYDYKTRKFVESRVEVKVRAHFMRSRKDWGNHITDDHKEGPAGGHAGGGYVTQYTITMKRIREYVERHPEGVTVRDIIDHCETHYASPRSGVSNALQHFERDWCEKFYVKGRLYFRPRAGGSVG